jgi:hypothetical protein
VQVEAVRSAMPPKVTFVLADRQVVPSEAALALFDALAGAREAGIGIVSKMARLGLILEGGMPTSIELPLDPSAGCGSLSHHRFRFLPFVVG